MIVFEQSNFIVSPLFQLPFPIFIMFFMLLSFKRIFFCRHSFLVFAYLTIDLLLQGNRVWMFGYQFAKVERSAGSRSRKTSVKILAAFQPRETLFSFTFRAFNSRQLLDAKKFFFGEIKSSLSLSLVFLEKEFSVKSEKFVEMERNRLRFCQERHSWVFFQL